MKPFSFDRLNLISPYRIWQTGDQFLFTTDYDVLLGVSFEEDDHIMDSSRIFWLNIINNNAKLSPRDPKVMPTIWAIIEEFFRVNPEVLVYYCDSANNQQAMRARLFHHWFEAYKGHKDFIWRHAEIPEEHIINYVAMIVQKNNPKVEEIVAEFDEQAKLLSHK